MECSALARLADFVSEFWLDLIAVAQRGAGIGDDGVAFAHALADLDVLVGMEAHAHAPRLDGAVAHHLHAGALGLVEDGGIRHRDAAAAAGVDGGAGEAAQAQRRIALDRDAHTAELRHRVDFRRHQADRAGQLAPVFDLDARGLPGRELGHVDAGDPASSSISPSMAMRNSGSARGLAVAPSTAVARVIVPAAGAFSVMLLGGAGWAAPAGAPGGAAGAPS